VTPNKGVRWFVARQFAGYCHSIPARGLHAIELFSDLVISEAEAVFIRQSKEISRHGLGRPQGNSYQKLDGPSCDPYGGGVFLWRLALKGCKSTLVTYEQAGHSYPINPG
jgi:hypothetical protein